MAMTHDTLNACHVEAAGYTRHIHRMTPHGCTVHPEYRILCSSCGWKTTTEPITLGGSIVALILDRDDGSVIEWLTADSGLEFARSIVHDGELVILDRAEDSPVVAAAMHEAILRADCFSVALGERFPSEAAEL